MSFTYSTEKVKSESPDVSESKRVRTECCPDQFASSISSDSPMKMEPPKKEEDTFNSECSVDEFAMKMGLACVICKLIEFSHRNQLIECEECHNLYHQDNAAPAMKLKKNLPREEQASGVVTGDSRKRETEKRQLEPKVKSKSPDVSESQRVRTECCPDQYASSISSDSPMKIEPPKKEEDTFNSECSVDEFAMKMGLACVICKLIEFSHRNQLIECEECHNLYHQKCHTPPAADHDVNDPPRVWYCAKCTTNMKKLDKCTMELDATFRKALKLLHTKTDEAALQLRQLLDDALAQKRAILAKERTSTSPKMDNEAPAKNLKKSLPREEQASGVVTGDSRKRETEKRQLEPKVKSESSDVSESKRVRTECCPDQYASSISSDSPMKMEPPKKEEDTDSSECSADEFAMEMGLACVICKLIEVSHRNQLIECQECHNLYHQECHRPPATDHDVNDPRRVWYCAKCTKNMKKLASKTQKTTKNTSSVLCKDSGNQSRNAKNESSTQGILLPFKRSELKAPSSQGSSTTATNKPIGLAGLAANLSGRSATTSTASSSSSSSTRTISSKPLGAPKSKTFGPFSALYSSTAAKNVTPTNSSSSTSKIPPAVVSSVARTTISNNYTIPTTSAVPTSTTTKGNSSPSNSSGKSSASTLNSIISVSSRAGSSNNGNSGGMAAGGAKPASSSSLMSADKRLQIMKKKAAKMQEKRRLSSK